MKVIEFIRLLRKHLVLLFITPLFIAILITFLTWKPNYSFVSHTTLYTGLATGSSIEMDKSFNFFATNSAFDNLINILKSRETQQEVAIRLLSQHLMLDKADPKYISEKSYSELRKMTPSYIQKLVVRYHSSSHNGSDPSVNSIDNLATVDSNGENSNSFSGNFKDVARLNLFPPSINRDDYEKTVKSLTDLMISSDTNFVYELLNYKDPHYSIKAISTAKILRLANSDLIEIDYEVDDPGICQQILQIFTEVSIRNYKNIKENRSDAVVKYFESQLVKSAQRLKIAEDKLLEFNKNNNIINYYEQSKAVAVVKENLEVEFNKQRASLAGAEASVKRLEEKLGLQEKIQQKSSNLVQKKEVLGALFYQIASEEAKNSIDNSEIQKLADLKHKSEDLKQEIKRETDDLYKYSNSIEGLPIAAILNEWLSNVVEAENLKAGLQVQADRIKEFQKQYAVYAPAGANIKRIEREISVSEQEFLEILHGLNLAKLKLQDNEMASNIKAVDPPFFPISPVPTKRKLLIIGGALFSLILVLASIFVTEYSDNTLGNPKKAGEILKINFLGVIPKVLAKPDTLNFPFVINRLLEVMIQNTEMIITGHSEARIPKILLIFSTMKREGKTVILANFARMLRKQGKKVLALSYLQGSLSSNEKDLIGGPEVPLPEVLSAPPRVKKKSSIIRRLLGYPDNSIDYASPFLKEPEEILGKDVFIRYAVDQAFFASKSYRDILEISGVTNIPSPDYVLIELPPVLYFPFPDRLVSGADICIMVCRSNRIWSQADQVALDSIMKLTNNRVHFVLNGVELNAVESVMGELPKKRSRFRHMMKNIFRLQFFSDDNL